MQQQRAIHASTAHSSLCVQSVLPRPHVTPCTRQQQCSSHTAALTAALPAITVSSSSKRGPCSSPSHVSGLVTRLAGVPASATGW
jgi:hypothetical protein